MGGELHVIGDDDGGGSYGYDAGDDDCKVQFNLD